MKLVADAKYLIPERLAAAPANPPAGRHYFDTTRNVERYWNGTAWIDLDEPVTVSMDLPPAATTETGDLWWDSDEVAPGINTPLTIVNGGSGATSPAGARASFGVPGIGNSTTVAGPPTAGTFARGDQWLDSNNVVWTCVTAGTPGTWVCPPGTEFTYVQITSNVSVTANAASGANLVIDGGTRTYDGLTAIIVEFYSMIVQASATAGNGTYINLWDNAACLGEMGDVYPGQTTNIATPVLLRRKLTPTAGSHNFRIGAWVQTGTGIVYAGPGSGAGSFMPAFMRITKA